MKIQITARHFEASNQLYANIKENVEKVLKFNDSISGVHVVLDAPTAASRKAEMTVKILDKVLHAHAEEDNMHKAIESMLGKIERQLKKENEKMKVHKSAPMASLVAE